MNGCLGSDETACFKGLEYRNAGQAEILTNIKKFKDFRVKLFIAYIKEVGAGCVRIIGSKHAGQTITDVILDTYHVAGLFKQIRLVFF